MYARAQRFASKFWVRMIEVLGKDLTCKDLTKESRFCLFKHVLFIYMSFFKAPLGAKGNGKRKRVKVLFPVSLSHFLNSYPLLGDFLDSAREFAGQKLHARA